MEEIINKLPDGTLLSGKSYQYRVVKALGQGSFGITYLATVKMVGALGALESNMYVCIKEFFMKGNNGRQGTMVSTGNEGGFFFDYKRKFMHEASNLSRLHHPGIIKVLEDFEANNTAYYVMEFIDGGSLNDYIAARGSLPISEAVDLIRQVGEALSYMHSMKMLHLDLKPGNIMRRKSGELVLIDFGLSKQYNEDDHPETSTHVGQGTPGYAPLEQMSYRDGRDFPVTMDVYALTGTFYKMLTGYPPRDASDILNYGLDRQPLIERGVGEDVIALIERGLSPIKFNRHQSVDEFLQAVNQLNVSSYTSEETLPEIPVVTGNPLEQVTIIKKSPAIPEYTIPLETEKVEISIEDPGWTAHYIISRKEASKRRGWTMDYDVFPIGEEEFSSFLSSLRTLDLKLQPEVEVAKDADFGSGGFFFKLILFDKHGRQLANYWYSVTLTGDRYGNIDQRNRHIDARVRKIIPKVIQDPPIDLASMGQFAI